MYRILADLYQNNVKTTGEDLLTAIVPLLKLLSLSAIGVLLGHRKTQIVPRATFRLLSKLVFALFLPCLIFTELGESITLQNAAKWWFIPVNVLISTIIGALLGCLVVIVCRPPPAFNRFTVVMTAFGNTGNLPLAVVASVCHTADSPFGHRCHSRGVAYVSFAQWVAVILVYTLVYHMMEPPLEYYEVVEEEAETVEQTEVSNMSRPLIVEAEWPGMEEKETEHSKTPMIARIFNSISSLSQTNFPDIDLSGETGRSSSSPRALRCLAEPRVVRRIRIVAERTPLQHILQPPTIASLLAIIIGMVPQLKAFIFGSDAPLSFVTDSLEILAGAMVPSVMLILGGMLSEGPNESRLGLRTIMGIIVARLLVLPLVGIGIVTLAGKLNLLVDKMFGFVLLLQYTTPSAILLGAIASLRGYAVSEASALLFWQHVFALFSLSLYVFVYFNLLPHMVG